MALATWYENIEYDDLEDEQKASVAALNLEGLLTEQLQRENIDIQLTKSVLRRLSQLQDAGVADEILISIDTLYPVFTDVIDYLDNLKHLTESQRFEIGKSVVNLMDNSVVSHLEYHRLHLLNLFGF